jgi:intracellular septation protein
MTIEKKPLPMHWKLVLDWAPLALFFAVSKFYPGNDTARLLAATAVLMVAVTVVLTIDYVRLRKLSPVPLITAILVLIFGGLTLYLKDPRFIKFKPTAVFGLIGLFLIGGLATGRPLVKYVLSDAFQLTEIAWRKLTFRYALLCFLIAGLNEVIWRNFSQNVWINFHTFGTYALMFLFFFSQMPMIMKHQITEDASGQTGA